MLLRRNYWGLGVRKSMHHALSHTPLTAITWPSAAIWGLTLVSSEYPPDMLTWQMALQVLTSYRVTWPVSLPATITWGTLDRGWMLVMTSVSLEDLQFNKMWQNDRIRQFQHQVKWGRGTGMSRSITKCKRPTHCTNPDALEYTCRVWREKMGQCNSTVLLLQRNVVK